MAMVPPAVSSNAVMHCCFFRFMLIMSVALTTSGHLEEPTSPASPASRSGKKTSSMMRRETTKPKEGATPMLRKEAPATVEINSSASLKYQEKVKLTKAPHWHDSVLSEQASIDAVFAEDPIPAAAAARTDATPGVISDKSTGDAPKPKRLTWLEKREAEQPTAAFLEDTASAEFGMKTVSTVQMGMDEKKRNAALLSAADEELYYKFFPEEKPMSPDEVSALEVGKKSAFKIRVPVSGGKHLCLTEDNFNHQVRAEPCRKHSTRQRWYWMGSKLKNLKSRGNCLGLAHIKKDTSSPEGSKLAKMVDKLQEAWSHTVSMKFKCSEQDQLLRWELDEHGRLKSTSKSQCLAINEKENFNAFVLPCAEGVTKS